MPQILQETENQSSTSSYLTLLKCNIQGRPKSSIVIRNAGPNSIKWRIMVSNDRTGGSTTFGEEKAEDTLTSGSSDRYVISGCFGWIDLQIVDASGGSHGTCSAYLSAVGV